MIEQYKIITEYPKYAISDFGNIKNIETNKLKRIYDNGHGYKTVSLSGKLFYVHRLVCKYFLTEDINRSEVNHIDGNKSNNHVSNLEWCTKSENLKHRYRVLKYKPNNGMLGIRNELCVTSKPVVKLSLDGFILDVFQSQIEVTRSTGIDRRNLSRAIKNNKKLKGYLWA